MGAIREQNEDTFLRRIYPATRSRKTQMPETVAGQIWPSSRIRGRASCQPKERASSNGWIASAGDPFSLVFATPQFRKPNAACRNSQ